MEALPELVAGPTAAGPAGDLAYRFVTCPFCTPGTGARLIGRAAIPTGSIHPLVWECRGCRLVYANPQATPESLERYYSSTYHQVREERAAARPSRKEKHRADAGRLKARLGEGATILDLGCAAGEWLSLQAQEGHGRLIGVELGATMAEEARRRVPGATIHVCEPADAPIEPGSVDFINFWHVLEHLPEPFEPVRLCFRWLKPGGVLNLGVPSGQSPYARLRRRVRPGEALIGVHTYLFGLEHGRRLLRSAGFEIRSERLYTRWPGRPAWFQAFFGDRLSFLAVKPG